MYVADAIAALDRFGPKLVQIYGQGESPMTISVLSREEHAMRNHPRWRDRLGSVGIAQSVVEMRVAGEDDATLLPGAAGEVLVRGDSVMKGYWRNPEARSEEHTSELQSLMRNSYAVFCVKKKQRTRGTQES